MTAGRRGPGWSRDDFGNAEPGAADLVELGAGVRVSIVQTVLVFVGIPAGLFALITVLVLAPSAGRTPRYRPNGGWQYKPVWYLPHPEHSAPISATHLGGTPPVGAADSLPPVTAAGGASGEW